MKYKIEPFTHLWLQIADGMDFLTERNIYQGDLAARSVSLTDALDTKVSDFGLLHRLYFNDKTPFSLKKDQKSLPQPIKWIAIELLTRQEFIPIKSDVWSFGVTTWEIFSMEREPYIVGMHWCAWWLFWYFYSCIYFISILNWKLLFDILGIDLNNLVYDLSFGVCLPEPKFCPEIITDLIKRCFYEKSDKRPDFKAIKLLFYLHIIYLFQIRISS